MNNTECKVGVKVRSLVEFNSVPIGTCGIIDEDYGSGITVAWDLPDRKLPFGYNKYNGKPAISFGQPLRDGFDKDTELQYLEKV